jgi:hypothetical protein
MSKSKKSRDDKMSEDYERPEWDWIKKNDDDLD